MSVKRYKLALPSSSQRIRKAKESLREMPKLKWIELMVKARTGAERLVNSHDPSQWRPCVVIQHQRHRFVASHGASGSVSIRKGERTTRSCGSNVSDSTDRVGH